MALQLAAIAVVPMVAVSALALERIHREEDVAAEGNRLIADVELRDDIAAIYAPANLERVALSGLTAIDDLGVERGLVTEQTGVDFEATYESNKRVLDFALRDLAQQHANVPLLGGESLGDRLEQIIVDLDEQRELSARFEAVPESINQVFERIDATLAEALTSIRRDPTQVRAIGDPPELDALANVLASAGELSQAVVSGLLSPSVTSTIPVVTVTAVHDTYVGEYKALLTTEDAREFDHVRSLLMPPPARLIYGTPSDANVMVFDPSAISELSAAVVNQLDYLLALERYSSTFHDRQLDDAHRQAALANERASQTKWLVATIGLLALLLTLLVLGSTAVPLLRLNRRATQVSNGDIDPEALPVRGPRLIRRLTTAMNDMLVTLHGVELQIARMSSGNLDRADDIDLPGAIGVSMRHSVRRLSDVTEQLHRSEQLSSAIVEQAADAIWTIDAQNRILLANDSAELLTGVPEQDQIGQLLTTFVDELAGETYVHCADGTSRKVLVASSVIDSDGDSVTTVIAHDISERSRFEAELAHQARHDQLTRLPNRFAAMEHLEQLLADAQDFSLLFIDIDGFKSVNDTQGHEAGDAVLTEIAERLSRRTRAAEFVARLGGDEFIVVQTNGEHIDDAVMLGRRLIQEIELPYDSPHGIFALSASVGVVRSDPDMTALSALRQADTALYLAKERGRGRVEQFDANLQSNIHREAELALALRHAVRNQELELHLQPIISLGTGLIDSAEALVRWNRPGVGLVGPNEFIPIAERSSLIFDIERWVLTRVCSLVASWRAVDAGCTTRVAINISGRHLIEGDVIGALDIALAATGADPNMLEFELTETQLLEDFDRATAVLNSARARGITIAVDDFGTGYSSMSYLRHFPVDSLKIDRSFVARSTEAGYDSTIIEAVLTIARSLDLDVVAEGIETAEQLEHMRSSGCHRAQGFHLARPMPIADAEAVIFGPVIAVSTP
ncbi:MAG: EAL domain-containing protein [Ilumatobacter sp.]|nr:EAL domain-containing protein [Ilumatobacter sp.]